MKKAFTKIMLCFGFAVLGLLSSFACSCGFSKGGDDSDLIPDDAQSKISAISSVNSNTIEIKLSSDSKLVGTSNVKVVALKAYQYLEGDNFAGLSQDIIDLDDIENYTIGDYTLGSEKTISFDRYDDMGESAGYDNLYNKYYLVHEDRIVKGPIYATEIEAKYNETPVLNIKSKKGLFAEWNGFSTYKDLGASHTVINFPIETLIHPNELFEDGVEVPLEISEQDKAKYIEFVSNGKTYYFKKNLVEQWDKEIKDYYSQGSQITAIIVARPNSNEEQFPQKFTYAPYSTQGTKMMGLNTSNSYGFNYYVALIEFLANRYSENNFAKGYISNYVIGNEIDYAKDYNRISAKQASLDTYMEEYSRLMRLCNLATRKYSKNITVAFPTTQAWAQRGYTLIGDQVQAYVPKQMIEWLNVKTKMEGDYNWGLSPHVYGYHLPQAGVYYLDTYKNPKTILGSGDMVGGINAGMTNDYNTTSKITFSNLELLDDYLNQDSLKYGDTARSVYLTESGVSSFWNGEPYGGENIQAATIASVYYKISQLDSIKSFSYYRAFDNKTEADAYALFGLLKSDYKENATYEAKPAYEVYKYIDTQYSKVVAEKYLKYIEYFDKNQNLQKYGEGFNSYEDLLNIFDTNHVFDFDWGKATPVTVDRVYEYEDKIDMQGVKFESQSFLFDGNVHSLSISGNLPTGVTVEYSQNNSRSEIGSTTVLATFTKDEEIVARRQATLEVSKIYTNKKEYAVNEKIFVTPYIDLDLGKDAWIGIYKENASIETDPSLYWYSFNTEQDGKLRTICLQEQMDNKQGAIIAGNYTICYFTDGSYNVRYKTTIKVLPTTKINVDLTNVEFVSDSLTEDGGAHSLLIKNEENLPNGVTVNYEGNNQSQPGIYQIKANFIKDDKVIEIRYAVLTIEADDINRLVINKTQFEQGEDILITATAPANSANKTWWVGLYLLEDDLTDTSIESIYWYYVKDDLHTSGTAYNIKEQSHNKSRSDYVNLPVGNYKVVLYNTSGYTIEKTVEISIVPSISTETGTISTDKTSYAFGEDILVTATCPTNAGSSTYWVGLYLQDETPSADVVSIYWYYVKDNTHVSGTAYNIKQQESNASLRGDYINLPAGNYKLVLFNTAGEIEATSSFTIDAPVESGEPTISTTKTEYNGGETIMVTATCPNDGKYYWVGLYLLNDDVSNSKSIYWYEVSSNTANYLCVPSGQAVDIKTATQNAERSELFDLPSGEYKLVLFNSSGYTIKTSVQFTIVGD